MFTYSSFGSQEDLYLVRLCHMTGLQTKNRYRKNKKNTNKLQKSEVLTPLKNLILSEYYILLFKLLFKLCQLIFN